MWLARFAVRQPVLVNMVAIVVTIAGLLAFSRMTREELPETSAWFSFTTVVYPGATPEDIEELVLRPIEDELGGLEDLVRHSAVAYEGFGQVWAEFDPDIADLDRATLQFAQAVERAELPAEASEPDTRKWTRDFPAITVALRAEPDVPAGVVKRSADALVRMLEEVEGVNEVVVSGMPERELRVEVDRARAEALGLPLFGIGQAIKAAGLNLPAGTLAGERQELLVRSDQRLRGAGDVAGVVLRQGFDGSLLRVGDVGEVIDGFAEAETTATVDGRRAVLLTVMKSADGDLLRIVDGVEERVAGFLAGEAPPGVTASLHADASRAMDHTLGDLYANGAMGLALIAVLLGLFLGLRNAVMAAAGLPVALAGGILVMQAMGITINLLSLFSLIIVLGIVVDDAIVVIENIVRYAEKGHPMHVAAVLGTGQVMLPVLSATLTTCAAFLPLLVMTGVMGKFFSIIPKVVAAALFASLLEALIVLPSHMADFGKVAPHHATPAWAARGLRAYEVLLRWSLRHRLLVVGGIMAFSASTIAVGAAVLPVVLFTEVDADVVDVRVEMPVGTRLEVTEQALAELEQAARASLDPGVVKGVTRQAGYSRTDLFPVRGSHVGMLTVDLEPWEERGLHAERVVETLRGSLVTVPGPQDLVAVMIQQGPPSGKPVAIEIRGDRFEVLEELETEVREALAAIEGVRDVESDFDPGKQELRVRVDPERAARHGVDPQQVAVSLRYALAGGVATTLRDGQDLLDVRVRYADIGAPDALDTLGVPTPQGFVPLGEVATIERTRGYSAVRHIEGVRRLRVTADVDTEVTTSVEVNRAMQARFADVEQRLPGYSLHFGGEFEEVGRSFRSLFEALWIAVVCIYTILGAQFRSFTQPLVVLAAVPFSFMGVAVGLVVTGSSFGMLAGIGAVALTGIVVNDSLVLVSFINGKRSAGMELGEAVVQAGLERLRPIFLTSVTTIAGLMPLGLGWGGENPLLSPMATAVAWGLVFATGLTLVVVPCMYVSLDRWVLRLTGKPTVAPELDGLDDMTALAAAIRPEFEDAGPGHGG